MEADDFDDEGSEEDEDYNPAKDTTGEPGEGARAKRPRKGSKNSTKEVFFRRGGGPAFLPDPEEQQQPPPAPQPEQQPQPGPAHDDPKAAERKARTDALWEKLNAGKKPPAQKAAADILATSSGGGASAKPAVKRAEPSWMASLAALNPRRDKPSEGSAAAAAAAAAAEAIRMAGSAAALVVNKPTDGVVTVKETRRFAGQDIEIEKSYQAGTQAAKDAAKRVAPPSSGLDAMLQAMEKKRKLSVLDKTRMDWDGVKQTDKELQLDVETHKKSGSAYLQQQNFLKDVELREYERERDARLQADPRNRGRL